MSRTKTRVSFASQTLGQGMDTLMNSTAGETAAGGATGAAVAAADAAEDRGMLDGGWTSCEPVPVRKDTRFFRNEPVWTNDRFKSPHRCSSNPLCRFKHWRCFLCRPTTWCGSTARSLLVRTSTGTTAIAIRRSSTPSSCLRTCRCVPLLRCLVCLSVASFACGHDRLSRQARDKRQDTFHLA